MLAMIGIGIVEILILLVFLGLAVAGVVVVIVLITRSNQQKPPQTQSFAVGVPPASPPRDLEQELRMLAKLRDERVITEEDFNSKKKALLGI